MKIILWVNFVFCFRVGLAQDTSYVINVPGFDSLIISAEQFKNTHNIILTDIKIDEKIYSLSTNFNSGLQGEKVNLTILSSQINIIFTYTGNNQKGKFEKFYLNGNLLAKGRIVSNKIKGYYKEYDQNGKLILKCYLKNGEILTERRRFYRRINNEILCNKKIFNSLKISCVLFTNKPDCMKLLLPTDLQNK